MGIRGGGGGEVSGGRKGRGFTRPCVPHPPTHPPTPPPPPFSHTRLICIPPPQCPSSPVSLALPRPPTIALEVCACSSLRIRKLSFFPHRSIFIYIYCASRLSFVPKPYAFFLRGTFFYERNTYPEWRRRTPTTYFPSSEQRCKCCELSRVWTHISSPFFSLTCTPLFAKCKAEEKNNKLFLCCFLLREAVGEGSKKKNNNKQTVTKDHPALLFELWVVAAARKEDRRRRISRP